MKQTAPLNKSDASAKSVPKLPLGLRLIILTIFLPDQLSIFIAGLRLTEVRLVLLALTPFVFLRFGKKITSGRYLFVASDLFVVLASLWMFIGPAVTNGLAETMVHSGPIVLEFLVAYMSTRMLLTKPDHSLAFVNMLSIVIAIVGFTGLLDAVTGEFFIRDVIEKLGLPAHEWVVGQDTFRFGLRRAVGPLEHPILFGFVCAIGLLFAISIRIQWKKFCIFGCLIGVLTAGSTAPLQVVVIGGALLCYSRMFSGLRSKWVLLWAAIVTGSAVIFVSTDTPFGHLIELFTIDPMTAYYRLYIWRSVGPAILENPLFTIIAGEYDYTGSIDSVWLVLSLEYGMVCAILTALSMFGSCQRQTRIGVTSLTEVEKDIARTTSILILLSMFMGLTVHLWGASWVLVSLLVGLRANLGEAAALKAREDDEVKTSRWNHNRGLPKRPAKDLPATAVAASGPIPTFASACGELESKCWNLKDH